MTDKLREYFDEMVVFKDKRNNSFFKSINLPSFLRDYILKLFQDEDGILDYEGMNEFISKRIPRKEEWMSIKDRIVTDNERVKFLTKISIDIDVSTKNISFSLPDFGLTNKETVIEPHVWQEVRTDLISSNEVWGIVELGYKYPDDFDIEWEDKGNKIRAKSKEKGKIKLCSFKNFCPYSIDLDYYKDIRQEFDIHEWIKVLLGAVDYNADGYESEYQQLAVLTRLLPFVEKRLNLVELAPKGTGKSYLFGHVSKYGTLVDGGKITRTKMFYDTIRRKYGFIQGNDYVAIDEVKLVKFNDDNEMRSILQGYMEYGTFNVNGFEGEADAGIVFLGNISVDYMNEYEYMLDELPPLFQETALLDRIHGFIKGWDIPRMNESLELTGWALNSEYFCSIMHLLRNDNSYRTIVDRIIDVPEKADKRDTESVKRIATAYLKLLFPNVKTTSDISMMDFKHYCLKPAMKMRSIVREQQIHLDREYRGKDIPDFKILDTEE